MKKIAFLLLINCGLMCAQTKTVVTPNGEKVTINPFVNNGLTASNGYIQLGGALTKPSVLTTTNTFTLGFSGLQTGLGTDNVLVTDASTGVLKMISASAFTPYYWGVKGNPGTNSSTNFLGTTDSNDLVFRTNNIERVRINGNGYVGIGLPSNSGGYGSTPNYALDVVNDIHIISNRVNYTSGRLIFENQQVDWGGAQGSGMYMLDGQDNGSRREWFFGKPYDNTGTGGKSSFVLKSMQTDALNYSLAQNGTGSYHLYVDAINNRIGIGTITPSTALEVSAAADPLKLNGLQTAPVTDKILTVDNNGVVHKARSMRTGFVTCNDTNLITVNDPNITATSTIIVTLQDNSPYTFNVSCAEGPRVPGTSFSIKFYGMSPGPPSVYGATYLIFY